jgi:NRPS condensation-like uncharacterized protein
MIVNRKLAPNEQSMELLNRCAGSFNVVTISRIKGGLKAEIVRQALDVVQMRHPRLNSRLIGDLDNLHFEFGIDKIPLRIVHKNSSQEWQAVVLEELNQPIKSDQYLMRTVLIGFPDEQLNYLLTILHHAISDGLSAVQLHSEILTYCQKRLEGTIETDIPRLAPLPDIQALMPKSMQGKFAILKGILCLLKLQLKLNLHRPKTLAFEQCVPIESRRCGMVHRQLNQVITGKLVELCKKEKTTVQSALCTAMMMAVAAELRNDSKTKLRLSCRSFVDLRKRFQPEVHRENLGILVSSITSLHTLEKNTPFWNLARDVRRQLNVSLASDDIFCLALMTKKVVESLLSRPNEAPVTVALTNIGRIDIPSDYGLLKLEEISFIPAQAVFGGIFSAAVTTFQDTMILNFMFSEPSLSQEKIEILVDRTLSYIIDLCHPEKRPEQGIMF